MKTVQKIVNGKAYIYALDSIYINKGKTIQKNRSLGAAATSTNLATKKQDFQNYIIVEEARQRVDYWQTKASREFNSRVNMAKIEFLRAKLFQLKRNMGELGATAMESAFLIDFIYNSNKLEGSRVPKESIERIVRESTTEKNNEVKNTITAINYVKSDKFKFTVKAIEKLHDMLLAHEPANLRFRKDNDIVVGNSIVADYRAVKKELLALLEWNKQSNFKLYPLEQAFLFYFKFERIHPFRDGNGRVGRLLMNEILKTHRYHPMIIWNSNREAHMSAFAKSMVSGHEKYYSFMANQFVKTHEIYLKKIEKAYSLDSIMSSLLEPSIHDK